MIVKYTQMSNLIWDDLFSEENVDKPRSIQIKIIEKRLFKFYEEARKTGRQQILNHFKLEIEFLEKY